jgi:hypothetical protein
VTYVRWELWKIHDSYTSPSVVRVPKCMRVKWIGHAVRRGSQEINTEF